jgi:thiol-disulfide isomerase/thioredoxin
MRRMGKRVALIGLCLFSFQPLWAGEVLQPEPWLAPAPPFHLQDMQGSYKHLSDFRGRVMIINFWASWCQPCRQELPSLNRARQALAEDEVVMLAINLGEEPQAVEAFMNDFPIDFPVLIDQQGIYSQHWQVRALPTTFVLNPRGEIVYRVLGEKAWDDESLLTQIQALQPTPAMR